MYRNCELCPDHDHYFHYVVLQQEYCTAIPGFKVVQKLHANVFLWVTDTFPLSGVTFQEKSNLQELEELRTHFEVTVVEDCMLPMTPFGPLNKEMPMAPRPFVEMAVGKAEAYGSTPLVDSSGDSAKMAEEASEGRAKSDEGRESATVMRLGGVAGSDLAREFLDLLHAAVEVRVRNAPPVPVPPPRPEAHAASGDGSVVVMGVARVAVLFSGGVDSAVIAALVDR